MLLAIDVGNTQSHFGVFGDGELVEHWRVATEAEATADELAASVIGPGVAISMEALAERAAKLPPIDLGEPVGEAGGVIGRSTQASLRSGIVYGFAGAVDAIARRVQRELGTEAEFIATGGQAHAI